MMWVNWWVVSKPADETMVRWISAQDIINLALSEIVIAGVQRIAGAKKISIQEGNEGRVCRITQRTESVDEHLAPGSTSTAAHGPEIQPTLGVCLKLFFASQPGHHYVDAKMFVIPTLRPRETRSVGPVLLAHGGVELSGSRQKVRFVGGPKQPDGGLGHFVLGIAKAAVIETLSCRDGIDVEGAGGRQRKREELPRVGNKRIRVSRIGRTKDNRSSRQS